MGESGGARNVMEEGQQKQRGGLKGWVERQLWEAMHARGRGKNALRQRWRLGQRARGERRVSGRKEDERGGRLWVRGGMGKAGGSVQNGSAQRGKRRESVSRQDCTLAGRVVGRSDVVERRAEGRWGPRGTSGGKIPVRGGGGESCERRCSGNERADDEKNDSTAPEGWWATKRVAARAGERLHERLRKRLRERRSVWQLRWLLGEQKTHKTTKIGNPARGGREARDAPEGELKAQTGPSTRRDEGRSATWGRGETDRAMSMRAMAAWLAASAASEPSGHLVRWKPLRWAPLPMPTTGAAEVSCEAGTEGRGEKCADESRAESRCRKKHGNGSDTKTRSRRARANGCSEEK